MNVLQIAQDVGDQGGIAVYQVVLEKTLLELGHQVLTAANSVRQGGPTPERVIQTETMFGLGHQDNGLWDWSQFEQDLPWRPDVIICHQPCFPRIARVLSQTAPLFVFQHTYLCLPGHLFRDKDEVCNREVGWGCLPRWYGRRCGSHKDPRSALRMIFQAERDRQSLSFATKVVANSAYLANRLQEEGVTSQNLEVVHPGCALLISSPQRNGGARSETPVASFAGRIVYAKGLQILLEAFSNLEGALDVAGEGWYRERLKKADRPGVRFHGHLPHPNLRGLHEGAWVSALPSLLPEPFGMSGIEALACGTPVVAFDVGGISEWLTPEVGMLVDPTKEGKVQRLRAALSDYLSAPPSEALASACRSQAEKLCGFQAYSTRIQELLQGS